MCNFQNFWNSRLEWKTKQLNGSGNYQELRETGPWKVLEICLTEQKNKKCMEGNKEN